MALTAFDFLGRIIASWSAAFGGLDRLAVDDTSRGAGFAASGLARLQQQFKIDPLEEALVPPIVEIALHRGKRRKVLRQQAPLAAGSCDIQDRVDNGAQVGFLRTAQTLDCRHIRFDQPPLRIGKVACVTSSNSLILRTSDFGPHVVPHGLLDTTVLSQLTEITQFISGQPLSERSNVAAPAGIGARLAVQSDAPFG